LLSPTPVAVKGEHALAVDAERRFWLADGPCEVEPWPEGAQVIASVRSPLALEARALRLASGAIFVEARAGVSAAATAARASAGGNETELTRAGDVYQAQLGAAKDGAPERVRLVARQGALELAALDAPVGRAVLRVELKGGPFVAGPAKQWI